MSTPRLIAAAQLRYTIWNFVKANPAALMVEIFEQFPVTARETVRKAVIKMRRDGTIFMVGNPGGVGRYSATHIAPKTAEDSSRRMATAGKRQCDIEARARKEAAKAARLAGKDAKAAEKRAMRELARQTKSKANPEPWRTVNIGGTRTDLRDQRGQGAVPHTVSIRSCANI